MTLSSRIRCGVEAAPWVVAEVERLEQQLAESQAWGQALRGALNEIAWLRPPGKAGKFAESVEKMALQAVAMPYDDTALKALLRTERERCAKACISTDKHLRDYFASVIRALGD